MRVSVRSVTQTRRRKALWKLTELWKNQRTVFPQLLEPSVHTFHNAGCCWNFKHNISCTPPLYRQSKTLEQETGLELSRATMDGWVMQVGQMVMPVVGAMKKELLGGSYLQADETPVDVQMHDGRGHNHQAYLWQYSRPGGAVVFDFRLGRGREGPKLFLGKYGGILQTDGYVAYEKVGGPGLVHAGCWAHCRRGFANVAKLNPGDPVATPIVEKINALFAIDAAAREQGLNIEARHALRREQAPAVLEAIKA